MGKCIKLSDLEGYKKRYLEGNIMYLKLKITKSQNIMINIYDFRNLMDGLKSRFLIRKYLSLITPEITKKFFVIIR